jgi:hypothetical protein
MLSYPFAILEENGTAGEFALDDIYYDGGVTTGVEDGGLADGRRSRLLSNAPNPFNPNTKIRFELPVGGSYEITIFDVAGRRVAGFRGAGSAGENSVTWDGHDDAGRQMSSGIYFYSLEAGSYQATRKMTLVK